MSKNAIPEIPDNTITVTISLQDEGQLRCGFGWNIPDPETDEGNYLYVTGLGLLWMLTKNIDGLTRLGMTYEASRELEQDEEQEELHEAEIFEFPIKPTKH